MLAPIDIFHYFVLICKWNRFEWLVSFAVHCVYVCVSMWESIKISLLISTFFFLYFVGLFFFVFLVFFQSTMKMECSLYLYRSRKTSKHFVEMLNTADIHCCRPWYTQMVMIIIKSIFVQNNVNKCSNFSQQSQYYYHIYLGRVKKNSAKYGAFWDCHTKYLWMFQEKNQVGA